MIESVRTLLLAPCVLVSAAFPVMVGWEIGSKVSTFLGIALAVGASMLFLMKWKGFRLLGDPKGRPAGFSLLAIGFLISLLAAAYWGIVTSKGALSEVEAYVHVFLVVTLISVFETICWFGHVLWGQQEG